MSAIIVSIVAIVVCVIVVCACSSSRKTPSPFPPPPPIRAKCPFKLGDIVNYKDSDGYDSMKVIAYKALSAESHNYMIKLEDSNGAMRIESSNQLEYVTRPIKSELS